jgi:hypothetical protein
MNDEVPCNGVPYPPPDLVNWFTYHAPTVDQIPRYETLRKAALDFACVIDANCPNGPDKTAVFRKIREAVMTANASIACGKY